MIGKLFHLTFFSSFSFDFIYFELQIWNHRIITSMPLYD